MQKRKIRTYAVVAVLATLAEVVLGAGTPAFAVGQWDPGFGTSGTIVYPLSGGAAGVALQGDGKIVMVGGSPMTIARATSNGQLDSSFGDNGKVIISLGSGTSTSACDIAVQPDGKIVAVGTIQNSNLSTDIVVARTNADGTPDTSFGTNGIAEVGSGTIRASAMALQNDGKIVVAGNSTYRSLVITRLDVDGSSDATFAQVDDSRATGASDVAIQDDGKIVTSDYAYDSISGDPIFAVSRFNSDGAVDTTFGSSGIALTHYPDANRPGDTSTSVAVQQDGKILIAGLAQGSSPAAVLLARFSSTGGIDDTFGTSGMIERPIPNGHAVAADLALQQGGGIVVAGNSCPNEACSVSLWRFTPAGAIDSTFGTSGAAQTLTSYPNGNGGASSIAIQPDGMLVAVGNIYTSNGAPSWAAARFSPVPDNTVPAANMALPNATFQRSTRFTVAWSGSDASNNLANYDVRYQRVPFGGAWSSLTTWLSATSATSATFGGSPGYTYCFSARAHDRSGNVSAWTSMRCTAVPVDDRYLAASSGWSRATYTGCYLGTYTSTHTYHASLSRASIQAKHIDLLVEKCSTCGGVYVYWNGALIKKISLWASATTMKALIPVATWTSVHSGTLVVTSSSSKFVLIDGVAISPA